MNSGEMISGSIILAGMKTSRVFISSALLVVTGAILIALRFILRGPEPEPTKADCVPADGSGTPTSGFAATVDGEECAPSIDFVDRLSDWERSYIFLSAIGAILVLLGLVVLIIAVILLLVRKSRRTTQVSASSTASLQPSAPITSDSNQQADAQQGSPTAEHDVDRDN